MNANRFLSLALAATLAPLSALADHDEYPRQPAVEVHVHDADCGHRPPPGQPSQSGRYELRSVQRWVVGQYQEVWVPQRCEWRGPRHRHHPVHSHHLKCRGGYYQRRWTPGYYQTVQEWVWVPYPQPQYAPSGYGLGLGGSFGEGSASFDLRLNGQL